MHRPDPIDELRKLCQQLEHLNRVQSPIINYARQMLAWQFPEVAHIKSTSAENLPPLWGWLALRESEVSPTSWKRLQNQYSKSIAQAYGLVIDPVLRLHADWLCDIALTEQRIEKDIAWLLTDDCFKIYNSIFDVFGFGLRVRSRLLSRIYPFEAFLSAEGKPLIEYEVREVKKVEKERRDGVNIIKRKPGDIKRTKRNRSRDAFKMRIGMGTVLEQSGDELVEKASGSALCRMALWQYVLCQVETGKLKRNPVTQGLLDYKDDLKNLTTPQGKQHLKASTYKVNLWRKLQTCFLMNWSKRSRTQLITNN